jgi:hypothetical protein
VNLYDIPGDARVTARSRLVYAVAEAQTTAEHANDNAEHIHDALTRADRRRLRNLAATMAALGNYLHDLGYELAVQLVPAGQLRTAVLEERKELDRLRGRVQELERKPRCGRTDPGPLPGSTFGPCMLEHGHPGMHEEGSPTGFPVLHGARWAPVDQDDDVAAVRALNTAVHQFISRWAEADEAARKELWTTLADRNSDVFEAFYDRFAELDHAAAAGAPDDAGNAAKTARLMTPADTTRGDVAECIGCGAQISVNGHDGLQVGYVTSEGLSCGTCVDAVLEGEAK